MSAGCPNAKRAKTEPVISKVRVTVVNLGGDEVCQVQASTVRELKQKIEQETNVAAIRQHLRYAGYLIF